MPYLSVPLSDLLPAVETYEIKKTSDGAESQGNRIDVNSHVSMNMWGLTPEFVGLLEEGFVEFFENFFLHFASPL